MGQMEMERGLELVGMGHDRVLLLHLAEGWHGECERFPAAAARRSSPFRRRAEEPDRADFTNLHIESQFFDFWCAGSSETGSRLTLVRTHTVFVVLARTECVGEIRRAVGEVW